MKPKDFYTTHNKNLKKKQNFNTCKVPLCPDSTRSAHCAHIWRWRMTDGRTLPREGGRGVGREGARKTRSRYIPVYQSTLTLTGCMKWYLVGRVFSTERRSLCIFDTNCNILNYIRVFLVKTFTYELLEFVLAYWTINMFLKEFLTK